MPDHANSDDAAVQAQLDRLWALSPGADILGLERITRLLARVGDPHLRLPPVFHVAGTNGKGSTCAYLRAALEAGGYRVHAYSSPHLVRFNERIRLAGDLIADAPLAALLAEVLDAGGDIGASFFEVTTAAAFLAFARTPADACVIEVGLGGRLDATNVLPCPAVCGIAALGIDHQSFLGDTLLEIAGEKAGIAKPGVPLVTMDYPAPIAARIAAVAAAVGAPLVRRGAEWWSAPDGATVTYRDAAATLHLPSPALPGAFQAENYALAVAMLRRQSALPIDEAALAAGAKARWPARMQRLGRGPLLDRLPLARRRDGVWLDGAHNLSAARVIATAWPAGERPVLVIGMLANKDADGVLAILLAAMANADVIAVPIDGHAHHAPAELTAIAARHGAARTIAATSLEDAFDWIAGHGTGSAVLVAGSLYLAGTALAQNNEPPT